MKLVEHIEPIRLLTEEKIRSFCRFKFPDLKIEDIISILEYSDDWYADSSVGVVSVAFPDTSERSFGSYLEIMNDKSLQEVQLKADVKADYRLDGGRAALVKALMLKPKYKGYITDGGDGAFSFSGPISLYVDSLCPDMVVRGVIPTSDVRFADKPVTIQGKYEDIKKFLSLMFKQFGDASSWNGGFEFVKPLTPKMRWLIQTAYKMIDPKTAGQQAKPVADDYVLDKLPDPENPAEMKSRSGKALKNGDIVSVGGTRYIYSSDQYFQVGSNPTGTKQNQVPLQLIDGRFYGFSPETKTFSVKVDGSPSDVAEDAVMKSMPAKGNPVDP